MLVELTEGERKVLVELLDRAEQEFSNHGCNDFHLVKEAKCTPSEVAEIQKKVAAWSGNPDQIEDAEKHPDDPYTQDWMLFGMLKKKFTEAR
jgi:hypothetical protein